VQCRLLVQNKMTFPLKVETASAISRLHDAPFSADSYYNNSSSNWTSPVTPAITPVIPILPPPIVIAPRDGEFSPGIPVIDPVNSLSQPPAPSDHVEAPAVAMTTNTHGRVPRPITGRGCRDQLPITTAADTMVYLCLFHCLLPLMYKIVFIW